MLFSLAAFTPNLAGQDSSDDLKRLTGKWTVVAAEEAGAKKEGYTGTAMLIQGTKLTWVKPKIEDESIRLRIDSTQKPKHIDLEKSKDEVIRGIYSLEGDTLKVCMLVAESGNRPQEFVTKKGDHYRLLVLKREKQ